MRTRFKNNIMHPATQIAKNLLLLLFVFRLLMVEPVIADNIISPEPINGIHIRLSDEVQQAVNSGIALSITCQIAVRESFWLFALSKQEKNHSFSLFRHALSNRYIVKRDNIDTPHIFRTTSEATKYISIQAKSLLEFYSNEKNIFSARLTLNKYVLPGPMRLNAFISESWNLDTGWVIWKSAT